MKYQFHDLCIGYKRYQSRLVTAQLTKKMNRFKMRLNVIDLYYLSCDALVCHT